MADQELFVLVSMVDDFRGRGPAVIQWACEARTDPPFPYAAAIADHARLDPGTRDAAERAVRALLTGAEATALAAYLERSQPALIVRSSIGAIALPLLATEALALLPPDRAEAAAGGWLIRLSTKVAAAPVPAIGVAAPWSWPGLLPGDIPRLMAQRERLGLPSLPPVQPPGAVHPARPPAPDNR